MEVAPAVVAPVDAAPVVASVVDAAPAVVLVADPEVVEVSSSAPAVISRARQLTDFGATVLELEFDVERVKSPEEMVKSTLHEQEADSEVWVNVHASISVIIPVAPMVSMLYSPDMLYVAEP